MAIRTILEAPDPRLRVVSQPVAAVTDAHRQLIADMFETMYAAPGIGPAAIRARWLDEGGETHDEAIDGMLATCLQHEMDHLEGVLFIDHLSRLKREMVLKKLEKARRGRKAA